MLPETEHKQVNPANICYRHSDLEPDLLKRNQPRNGQVGVYAKELGDGVLTL